MLRNAPHITYKHMKLRAALSANVYTVYHSAHAYMTVWWRWTATVLWMI